MTNKTSTRSQSPKGCSSPLMTHLTPAERVQLEKMAQSEARSMSAMARLLIVRGMQQHKATA